MTTEMTVAGDSPPERLWRLSSWLVSRAAGRGYRLVMDQLAGAGVRREHYAVLAALDEFGPVSQATLGRRLAIDRSDIVAVLNDLERNRLVVRAPDRSDRRRNAIRMTAKGSRTLDRLDGLVNAAQDALLVPLSGKEREQLNGLLRRLVDYHAAQAK